MSSNETLTITVQSDGQRHIKVRAARWRYANNAMKRMLNHALDHAQNSAPFRPHEQQKLNDLSVTDPRSEQIFDRTEL